MEDARDMEDARNWLYTAGLLYCTIDAKRCILSLTIVCEGSK